MRSLRSILSHGFNQVRTYSLPASKLNSTLPFHFITVPPVEPPATPLPPVILLHGVLASSTTNRSILTRHDFVPAREKIAIDLPNHGRSPHLPPNQQLTYELMASNLADFLHHRQISNACFIGHSMGGKLAMHFALSNPHLVSELIVIDIAPITYPSNGDPANPANPLKVLRAMLAVNLNKAHTRKQVDEQLLNHGITSHMVRHFVMTNLIQDKCNPDSPTFRWRPDVVGIERSMPQIMSFPPQTDRQYHGRTCVIRGAKSNYVPFESMRTFVSLFPKTKLITMSDAGHWLQSQMPDQFCNVVNDFLS